LLYGICTQNKNKNYSISIYGLIVERERENPILLYTKGIMINL
jgi:hypothetical protein